MPFAVVVGNGDTIQCTGSCSDVPVILSDTLLWIPFYILPIHGADLVLGVQWLQTLGPFLSDYSVPSIQFSHNNKPITLMGSTSPKPNQASLTQFHRFAITHSIESLHTITMTQLDEPPPSENPQPDLPFDPTTLHPDIATLLLQFPSIFHQPHGLPPNRAQDHHIHLLPDSPQ